MKSISLKNFRCFHNEQEARLAPLTLLVGENSSGKTSFLALIRALWQAAYKYEIPDFKEPPYDLGTFEDITHHRGGRGGRAETFEAEFKVVSRRTGLQGDPQKFSIVFGQSGSAAVPIQRRFESSECWIEEYRDGSKIDGIRIGTTRGSWKYESDTSETIEGPIGVSTMMHLAGVAAKTYLDDRKEIFSNLIPLNNSPECTEDDWRKAMENVMIHQYLHRRSLYASAPVRSQPRRIYEPARVKPDPEGDSIPMHFETLYFRDKERWTQLKHDLERFGRASGLYNQIDVKSLGTREGAPFQLTIRKFGDRLKGPPRNLKDVGYGVSQVLPVITELLNQRSPSMSLLQQPEVHLHPSAQAALGSLFCQIAGWDQQLIVETHSDYILDRVRMDVRDKQGKLTPDDVSILYFELNELDSRIHSLRLDENGNILNAPESYRAFFMAETRRSLGF